MKRLSSVILSVLAFGVAQAALAAAPVKPNPALGATKAAVCMGCHAADGSRGAPPNPILQGQHPEYLVKQLHDFRSGKRTNAVMTGMAATLAEEDIPHVAAFFASKKAKPGAAKSEDLAKQGAKIYRGGIAAKSVAACAGCHSPNGAGIPAQFPRLAGQHREYTKAQLTAFRQGERTNSVQMTAIAANLSDKEIDALADYIAGLR